MLMLDFNGFQWTENDSVVKLEGFEPQRRLIGDQSDLIFLPETLH